MHHRNFDHDERHQKSFVFKFDCFTVVGKDLIPMAWQKTDDTEKMKKRPDKLFQISRCTSVVALSYQQRHGVLAREMDRNVCLVSRYQRAHT